MMGFSLVPGWNDIDLPIVRNRPHASAVGRAHGGLRLALGVPSGRASMYLDSLRIYQPSAAASIRWAAPGTSAATLWWTDSAGVINPVSGQHAGPVKNAAISANASAPVTANVAGYAPGTTFWSVATDGTKTLVGASAPAPLPVIDSPSAAGCGDYATRYLGHPWTFTSTRSLAARANIGALSFAGGVLSATNVGPRRNDPSISLPLPRNGLNGRVYHRLTIVESYDGPFNLANRPGGGTMARVLWQSPGHPLWPRPRRWSRSPANGASLWTWRCRQASSPTAPGLPRSVTRSRQQAPSPGCATTRTRTRAPAGGTCTP